MKTPVIFFFLICIIQSSNSQNVDSIPLLNSYYEANNFDIGYYGFQGNTIDITLSKKKVCKTCYRIHSKFIGGGFEIGNTIQYNLVGGPKIYYQRGQNISSFRISLGMLTDFDNWIIMLRPEYMVHFFKDKSLSFGLAFNFHQRLNNPDTFEFGILSFGARYYFEFDKQPSG